MNREQEIDAAMETASNCRMEASIMRQSGFIEYAKWLIENVRRAERWEASK